MERHEHTNPWADKLQEVQLPDANDSWNAMQVLLDKEMPSGGQYDKRRWLLVILLLLLLIGVCNCPRQGRWAHRGSSGPLPASERTASSDRISDSSARIAGAHRSVGPNPGVVNMETDTTVGVPDSPVGQSETRRPLRPAPDGGMPATRIPGGRTPGALGSNGTSSDGARAPGVPASDGISSDKSSSDRTASGETASGGNRQSRHKSDRITPATGPALVNHSGGSRPAVPSGISPDNGAPSGVSAATPSGNAVNPPSNAAVPKKTQRAGRRNRETFGTTGAIVKKGAMEKSAVRRGVPKRVGEEEDVVKENAGGNDVVKEDNRGKGIVKKGTKGKGIVEEGAHRKGSGKNIPEGKNTAGRTGPGLRSGTPAKAGTPGTQTTPGTSGIAGAPTTAGTPIAAGPTTSSAVGKKGKDPTVAGPAKPGGDTIAKKKPGAIADNKQTPAGKKAKEDTIAIEPDVYGWVAGIGFNQFFSVGQQQKSDYNSGGTTGGIGDYLPIPMVRYYFSRRLFVQMEAQFNAPQFTKKDLVAGQSAGVTLPSGQVQQNSVVVKKLFYFNLPLSVHYSPIKNLYLGAGLQYSRLSNGVGLYEDKVLVPGGSDTVKAAKVYSFKGDSIYQKMRTNEFRVLLDLNYTYKRFIIGARYNQALSKFINVHISDTQVTQARNSSLQLYIRYILWDGRKRKALSSK